LTLNRCQRAIAAWTSATVAISHPVEFGLQRRDAAAQGGFIMRSHRNHRPAVRSACDDPPGRIFQNLVQGDLVVFVDFIEGAPGAVSGRTDSPDPANRWQTRRKSTCGFTAASKFFGSILARRPGANASPPQNLQGDNSAWAQVSRDQAHAQVRCAAGLTKKFRQEHRLPSIVLPTATHA